MLYQEDDVDAENINSFLSEKCDLKIIRFGMGESRYSLDFDDSDYFLSIDGKSIERKDFLEASVIIFRLWRMDDTRFVKSNLSTESSRKFSEREWMSSMQSMLFVAEQDTGFKKWANPPSKEYILRSKPYLLYRASCYLQMPHYKISTEISLGDFKGDVAAKCISSNQNYRDDEYFGTCRFKKEDLIEVMESKQTTPAFLSEYIDQQCEVRTYFFYDEVFSIKLISSVNYSDIREVSQNYLDASIISIPKILSDSIKSFCKGEKINYCCFDFIVKDSSFYLVDITPNGTWGFYDSMVDGKISDFICSVVERNLK